MLQYDTLFNNPFERRRVTYPYVWWDNAFTNEQLDQICEIGDSKDLDDATIVGGQDSDAVKDIRRSKVKFIEKDNSTSWIFDSLNYVGQTLNNQYYNFNLNGYRDIQYTVYESDEEGMYDWHMDTILGNQLNNTWDSETRKLTLILLLSEPDVDFSGGELEINPGRESFPDRPVLPRGRILAFPSFMIHRVKPVTAGIRKSIVVWIEGPKFI
jgi:PKHD-type hydroxylase